MSYTTEVLADAPLVWYRLGEASGSTAVDSSGNGRNGTYQAVTLGQPSVLASETDTAAAFNGTASNVALGYDSTWMNAASFTVEAWVKTTAATGYRSILDRDSTTSSLASRAWQFRLYNGKLQFVKITNSVVTVTGTVNVADGAPHHVAATYDGASIRLYVDGVLDGTALSGAMSGNGAFHVGASQGGVLSLTQYFLGTVDEAALYGTALSGARIAAHHEAGTVAFSPDATINAPRATATAAGNAPIVSVEEASPDATITTTRAIATATGNAPTVNAIEPVDASVVASPATATASGNPPTLSITPGGLGVTIFATQAFARADPSDSDIDIEIDPSVVVIETFRANASVVAPDPRVSTTTPSTPDTRYRWRLYDPQTGEKWEFIHNPNQMISPHRPRAINIFVTPPLYNPAVEARGGMARVFETNRQPYEWSFSGWIRDEEQYDQLVRWTRKVNRVQLTDHFGRTWSIRFKEFDPDEQRPSHRSDWKFDYDIKATMYGAVA